MSDEEHNSGPREETVEDIMGRVLEGFRQFPPEHRGALFDAMHHSLELAHLSNVPGWGDVLRDGLAMLQALDSGELEDRSGAPQAPTSAALEPGPRVAGREMKREDWNQRYATKELIWTGEANRFLVAEAADLPPGRALDLAAGEGRNAVWLAERGWTVRAVDFSDVAVDKGRKLAASRQLGDPIDFVVADLSTYEPDALAFDLVAVFYLQLPQAQLVPILQRAAGAVAPGGTLLVVAHDSANLEGGYGGPQRPEVLYTPEQVTAALGGELVIEKASTVERPVETDDGTRISLDCLVRAKRR